MIDMILLILSAIALIVAIVELTKAWEENRYLKRKLKENKNAKEIQ